MIRYVKICPKCGHVNEEDAVACANCPEFFDRLGAVPLPEPGSAPVVVTTEMSVRPVVADAGPGVTNASAESAVPPGSTAPVPVTQRMNGQGVLLLRSQAGKQSFSVRSGLVVGQAHPSRPADVQIGGVPGSNCIHRQHCIFHCREGRWFVKPIDQRVFGKRDGETHPTALNGALVPPGTEREVRDGDLVTLAGVNFTVNILGT